MTGKFLKKILSAVMCTALCAGIVYSGNELARSLATTVFVNEISESENETTHIATMSHTKLSRRAANPTSADSVREALGHLDMMNKVMANISAVDPVGKVAVVAAESETYVDIYETADETSEVVGRFYPISSGVVEEKNETWTKLVSGDVSGYVKNEYVLFDDEAQAVLEEKGEKDDRGEFQLASAVSMEEIRAEEMRLQAQKEAEEKRKAQAQKEAETKEKAENDEAVPETENVLQTQAENDAAQTEETEKAAEEAYSSEVTSESYLLACIVYCESGNQSYEGQLAVANVVLNRVKSPLFPNTISEVVYQSGQFTPAFSGSLAAALENGPTDMSVKAANDALAGVNNIGDYLYFNGYVDTSKVNSYVVIEDHTFYN